VARTVFHGGRVFDGTGADLAAADVAIEDGRIVDVGTGLDGDEAIDCDGKALLPGLFDAHIHLTSRYEDDELTNQHRPFSYRFYVVPEILRTTLALGITTVRDAGGADAGLRQAVADGVLVGPRMQVSITMLSQTGGHNDEWLPSGGRSAGWIAYHGFPDGVCDGVDGCRQKVREVIRAGADVIKIASSGGFFSPSDDPKHPHFQQDELDAIVKTAADLGCWVMSHAHGPEGIKRAVRAGVRSIDHGTYLDEEAAEMMVEAGTWLVPTLTAGDTTEELAKDPKLPAEVREKFAGLGRPEFDAMRLAAGSGVKVAMGTDCPVAPHGWNLNELAHMANNGFTPAQALHAATLSAAEMMGMNDRLGSLEPGKVADMVVVDGDPFAFDTLKDRIEQVWKDGVRVVGA
jgi:imidazolonepropionase-like amidohydrolase